MATQETMEMDRGVATPTIINARPAVVGLAEDMEQKLAENDWKVHWSSYSMDYILQRAEVELQELRDALKAGDKEAAILEAADVSNFMMMAADNLRSEARAEESIK